MFGLISTIGLLMAIAYGPAPMPYTATNYPQSVDLIPSPMAESLMIEYSQGVARRFEIDFTQSPNWNVAPLTSSTDEMLFDGYWYVGEKATFDWFYDDDAEEVEFALKTLTLMRFEGSYDTDIRQYLPFPIAWQSYVSGNFLYTTEINSMLWRGINIGDNTYNINDSLSMPSNSNVFVNIHSAQLLPSANLRYYLGASDFTTWQGRISAVVYEHALSIYNSASSAYQHGYDNGKAAGERTGYTRGYNDGLDATGQAALAGSLFGSIVAIPFEVLNGLNSFVVWGIPIITVLVTFLMIGLIVVVIKRFV